MSLKVEAQTQKTISFIRIKNQLKKYLVWNKGMEIEKLDVKNIIEINQIRGILQPRPELLTIFEMLCKTANQRLNTEAKKIDNTEPVVEDNIEPELDSDSDDDIIEPLSPLPPSSP
tara:strand:+ start:414 stop:761 length:348 start_codon:yes stop_codon:yes gene_type:complete